VDRIDLRQIDARTGSYGNQAFNYVGYTTADAKTGQIAVKEANGYTYIEGDVGYQQEFLIRLNGTDLKLDAGDFLL
jgi:hypothetical protein